MIRELAVLQLEAGTAAAFEAAFAGVVPLLAAADGHRRHRLVAALDQPDTYLLEVDWHDLAAHVERFEPSAAHARFMASLDLFLKGEPESASCTRRRTRRFRSGLAGASPVAARTGGISIPYRTGRA